MTDFFMMKMPDVTFTRKKATLTYFISTLTCFK